MATAYRVQLEVASAALDLKKLFSTKTDSIQPPRYPPETVTMATKTDFSTTEWDALRNAPHLAALAVAAAGASV